MILKFQLSCYHFVKYNLWTASAITFNCNVEDGIQTYMSESFKILVKLSVRAISPFLNFEPQNFFCRSIMVIVNGIVQKLALKTPQNRGIVVLPPKLGLAYIFGVFGNWSLAQLWGVFSALFWTIPLIITIIYKEKKFGASRLRFGEMASTISLTNIFNDSNTYFWIPSSTLQLKLMVDARHNFHFTNW